MRRRRQSSNTLPRHDEARRWQQSDGSGVRKTWFLVSYITRAQMLVVINFILQIALVVLGQINSNPKPLSSLILMLLSLASLVLGIIELVYRWKSETVTRGMWRSKQLLPFFRSPTNGKSFFSWADIVGLSSAILQFVFTTVNYALLVRHTNTQIQITVWPIFFAFVLLYSTFQRNWTQTDQLNHVQLDSIIIDTSTPEHQESFTSLQDHLKATGSRYLLCSKITIAKAFAIVNFILELLSAIFDQLSSEPKPLYALILMLLSFASLLLCIIELLHKGKTERVKWSWKRNGKVRWLYPNKPFFSFWDKVGLICAVVQPIPSTVNYALVLQRRGQVQISVLPLVFALALSCSEIWESPNMTGSEGNIDEEEQVGLINRGQGVTEVSPKKESEPTASEEGKSGLTNQSKIRVNEEVFPKPEKSVVEDDNKIVPETEDGWVLLYEEQTPKEIALEMDEVNLDLFRLEKLVKSYVKLMKFYVAGNKPMSTTIRLLDQLIITLKMSSETLKKATSFPDELQEVEKCVDKLYKIRNAMVEDLMGELASNELTNANSPEERQRLLKNFDEIDKMVLRTSLGGIKKIPKTGKFWAVERTKESVWRKEKDLMREPTRRKTDNALRRRVKSKR